MKPHLNKTLTAATQAQRLLPRSYPYNPREAVPQRATPALLSVTKKLKDSHRPCLRLHSGNFSPAGPPYPNDQDLAAA